MSTNLIYLLVGGILTATLIFLVRVWRSLNDKVDIKEFEKKQALLEKEFYDVVLKNKEDIEVLKTESFNKKFFKKQKLY
jgi:hypothetical protein